MSPLLEQTIAAVWATKRAFRDAVVAFVDCYGERFVYWWGCRDERRTINKTESQWP